MKNIPIFVLQKFDLIKYGGILSFYKISMNGVCQFDEFCEEVTKTSEGKRKMNKIYTRMNYMAENNSSLPQTKFNSIKNKQKVFAYEFKEQDIRIYVLKKDPNVYIICGGYKKNQGADISTLLDIIKTKQLDNFIKQIDFK